MANWLAAAYGTAIPLQVAFAIYALAFGYFWQRRQQKAADTETFVTARSSQGMGRIGWSFFASAVGAWVIVSPGSYASFAGIVGVVVYALFSGIPILMISTCGEVITAKASHVFSLGDFMGMRYGPIARTLVVLMALFNMSIALTAEYTTIGTLFSSFVGSMSWPIILTVGVVTLAYTAYGGLVVSIATDQIQGIATVLLTILLTIYVAVTFRQDIPNPLPSYSAGDAFDLGANESGWTSIFTLGVSLSCATVYSEAMWQRVWASASKRVLRGGAALGCSLIIVVVFLSGFGSWLAMAGGLATADTDPNLYLFQLFSSSPNSVATLNSWVSLVTLALAVIMNEGAIDSIQNGLASAVSGQWLKNAPLMYSRIAVVLINIPLLVVGSYGYNVLQLFLITNLLCACGAIPVLLGLWRGGQAWIHETAMVFGTCVGILAVTALGIGLYWVPGDVATSFSTGANWAWYANNYDWRAFLTAITASTGATLLWAAAAWALERTTGIRGPGISGVLMRIPGMRVITGTPDWDPRGDYLRRAVDAEQALPPTKDVQEPVVA